MSKKIVVSQSGYDAFTDSDIRHLAFSSDYASLKYFAEGSYSAGHGTGVVYQTIAHNLGYVPFFVAYFGELGVGGDHDYCMCPFIFAGTPDPTSFFVASAWADATNIYLQTEHNIAAIINVTFYYKIFKNSLGL